MPTDQVMLSVVDDIEVRPSFESLFQREFPHVARTVFLILYDRDNAQEVAQDAFAKLLQHWDRVSQYERPDAWVRRVAIRIAIRRGRRELRRPSLESRAAASFNVDVPDPDVLRALTRLTAKQRACVVLFYWEDRPVSEIAAILETSESTVKQHLHRARTHLRELLGEEADDATR